MNLRFFPILLVLAALWTACASAPPSDPAAYAKDKVYFGSGGGITGAVTTYCLLKNGHLYEQKWRDTSFSHLRRVPRKQVAALFEQIEGLSESDRSLQAPGNIYSFIELPGGEAPQRISWGSPGGKASEAVEKLYADLMATLSPEK
jgi:hypothetical protein